MRESALQRPVTLTLGQVPSALGYQGIAQRRKSWFSESVGGGGETCQRMTEGLLVTHNETLFISRAARVRVKDSWPSIESFVSSGSQGGRPADETNE